MSNNPMQTRDISVKTMATICATHGFDRLIIVMQRDGDEGATLTASCGLGARNKMIAESIREEIQRSVLGWEKSDEAKALDKMVEVAEEEMATGPENDPDYGKRLIVPVIGMKKERDRKPR